MASHPEDTPDSIPPVRTENPEQVSPGRRERDHDGIEGVPDAVERGGDPAHPAERP